VSDGIIGSIELENNSDLLILNENNLKLDSNLISKEFEYITNKI
jgi:hypothetical protein